MRFTSDLEDEIELLLTSDLEDEIGITQDEIENQFGPGGRNHLGPGTKSLRTWDEIT